MELSRTFFALHVPYPEPHDIVLKLLSVDPANYPDAPSEGIRRIIEQVTGTKIPKGEPIDLSPGSSIRMGTTVASQFHCWSARATELHSSLQKALATSCGLVSRPALAFDLSVSKLGLLYEDVIEIDERVTIEGYSENNEPETFDVEGDDQLVVGISGEVIRVLENTRRRQDQTGLAQSLGIRHQVFGYFSFAFIHLPQARTDCRDHCERNWL